MIEDDTSAQLLSNALKYEINPLPLLIIKL
jgi:hypothetical protein